MKQLLIYLFLLIIFSCNSLKLKKFKGPWLHNGDHGINQMTFNVDHIKGTGPNGLHNVAKTTTHFDDMKYNLNKWKTGSVNGLYDEGSEKFIIEAAPVLDESAGAKFGDSVVDHNEIVEQMVNGQMKSTLRGVPLRSPLKVQSLNYFDSFNKKIIGIHEVDTKNTQTGQVYYSPSDGIFGDTNTCFLLKEVKKCIVYSSCGWCDSINKCLPGSQSGPSQGFICDINDWISDSKDIPDTKNQYKVIKKESLGWFGF